MREAGALVDEALPEFGESSRHRRKSPHRGSQSWALNAAPVAQLGNGGREC